MFSFSNMPPEFVRKRQIASWHRVLTVTRRLNVLTQCFTMAHFILKIIIIKINTIFDSLINSASFESPILSLELCFLQMKDNCSFHTVPLSQ